MGFLETSAKEVKRRNDSRLEEELQQLSRKFYFLQQRLASADDLIWLGGPNKTTETKEAWFPTTTDDHDADVIVVEYGFWDLDIADVDGIELSLM